MKVNSNLKNQYLIKKKAKLPFKICHPYFYLYSHPKSNHFCDREIWFLMDENNYIINSKTNTDVMFINEGGFFFAFRHF